jgi:GxxExxY protein
MDDFLYKEEGFRLIGVCMEVHRILGRGLLEVVYKDALEYEFQSQQIPYAREKPFEINYKGVILPHKFFADFVMFDAIILEVKAVSSITNEFLKQTLNYMAISRSKVGYVVNFGANSLQHKRLIL